MVSLVSEERPAEGRPTAAAGRPPAPGPARPAGGATLEIGERALFGTLLVAAALVRLVGLGSVEPNVSVVEARHLITIEALLLDRGPVPLGGTDAGASGLALMVPALLRLLRPEPELALRLYAALGGIILIALFYGLCRSRHRPLPSLAATALLAFAPWSLFFGRNGELNVYVAVWLTAAAWQVQRASQTDDARRWLLAGAAAAAGLYWHPAALWTLPALLVTLGWTLLDRPAARRCLVAGLGLFLVAAVVVALPRLPAALVSPAPAVDAGARATPREPPEPPLGLRARLQQTVRAFIVLDPTASGEPRYLPSGRAPLDGLTGLLLLGGVTLGLWRFTSSVVPLALFLVPLVGSQLTAPRVPDLGAAAGALPGLYLLVADALAWLLAALPFATVVRAAVVVALPAYAVFGWQSYAGWMGSPASAQARQPAQDYDEVDTWLAEQRSRLLAGQPPITASQWRDEHPRLTTGARAARRPRQSGPARSGPDLGRLELREIGTVTADRGPRAPRGLVATATSEVVAADVSGRLSRVGEAGRALRPSPRQPPTLEQISDLAADPAGFLYLADAERSLVVKLDPSGSVAATLAGDWGMYRPRGLTVGPDGRIYAADTGRNRVVIGTTEGRLVTTIGPKTSAGELEQPTDVAVDVSGRIYVALPEIGRVAVFDESGQQLGGWAIPRGNTVDSPHLEVVADGAVAVTDPAQRKVRLFDADGRELAVAEVPDFPYGAAVAGGLLYVSCPPAGQLVVFSLGLP